MSVEVTLRRLGGVATSSTLIRIHSRPVFRQARLDGTILRAGPDRYVLPGGKERIAAAARVNGSLTHLSAAQHHGWRVKNTPEQVQVVVPRGRKVSPDRRVGVELFRGPTSGLVTDKVRTVIDCARKLPFDAALGVADSALKDPDVTREALMAAAMASPRTGRGRVIRVIEYADSGAANTFESSLRALAIEAGLQVETQVLIGNIGQCDVADRGRRIAIEGDSYRYHSKPSAFRKDVRRYTTFARLGWIVVRFTVEDVLDDPDYVLAVLRDVCALRPQVGVA